MQPITFCNRCRGMKTGWNSTYVLHCLRCEQWIVKSIKIGLLTVVLSFFVVAFPTATGTGLADSRSPGGTPILAADGSGASAASPLVRGVDTMLARYRVDPEVRERAARAIVASSIKYDVAAELIASIVIVESRANPFAISDRDAVGIMQIHVPTWGKLAEEQDINLFKLEDNVDLGTKILKEYMDRYGLWEGVARYNGFTEEPGSWEAAQQYVAKVQRVYGILPPEPPAEAGDVIAEPVVEAALEPVESPAELLPDLPLPTVPLLAAPESDVVPAPPTNPN